MILITETVTHEQLMLLSEQFVGLVCWAARMSYPEQLTLHVGLQIPYGNALMTGKLQGEWRFGSQGTHWTLDLHGESYADSDEAPDVVRAKIMLMADATITAFEPNLPNAEVAVAFSNGARLSVVPTAEDDAYADVALWELARVGHMTLRVFPGGKRPMTTCPCRKNRTNRGNRPVPNAVHGTCFASITVSSYCSRSIQENPSHDSQPIDCSTHAAGAGVIGVHLQSVLVVQQPRRTNQAR